MSRWYYSLALCLSLTACGGLDTRRVQPDNAGNFLSDGRLPAAMLVYDCNGYEFIARPGQGEMALWLEDRYVVLSQVRSASGALYEQGEVSFWSKGDEAILTVAGQSHQNCHQRPDRVPWEDARRRGVDFRAVGHGPHWYLEILSGRQLLFALDDGMQRVLVTDPLEQATANVRTYHGVTTGHAIQVEIVEQTCIDTVGGDALPSQVVVILDHTRFEGCGRHLDNPWEDLE